MRAAAHDHLGQELGEARVVGVGRRERVVQDARPVLLGDRSLERRAARVALLRVLLEPRQDAKEDAPLRVGELVDDEVDHAVERPRDDLCGNQNVQDTFNMVYLEQMWQEGSARPRDLA